jgi:acetylglutamate synthase
MTSWEIEGLTKNILMFDTDLKTESNVYKILHDIANQMSDDETASDLYYDYLLNHIEKVIDSYFDQQLEPDEYITVIKEVIMCIKKYEGLPILADVVRNLEETFDHFILGYDSSDDDNDDEKSIADQLEKMEREMR